MLRIKMSSFSVRRIFIKPVRCILGTFDLQNIKIILPCLLIIVSLPLLYLFANLHQNVILESSIEATNPETTSKQDLLINNTKDFEISIKKGSPQFPGSEIKGKRKLEHQRKKPTTNYEEFATKPTEKTFFTPEYSTCPITKQAKNDFDSVKVFSNLSFGEQNIWDNSLEERYLSSETKNKKFPLKVIIVPHSHSDPGWGWVMHDYYNRYTKNVLDFMIIKLSENKNMTFIWSEMSFLNIWWEKASTHSKQLFKQFIKEGRLEITTGGWVMTDEAVVHLYSMVTQLIEGQEWLKHNIGDVPTSAWSVDPFGFSSVMPYLLKSSQVDSMLILRIHYAWKKWLAKKQYTDFRWGQRWDDSGENSILCHQHPFMLYTMTTSLGPNQAKSHKFDFIVNDANQVSPLNVESYSKDFLEEAGRTGSITKHNVVLAILGNDFTFRNITEWDNSYTSFMQLFEEINSKPELYSNANVQFGTVKTYFNAVRERQPENEFPTFNGDFFVYSDAITNVQGRSAYWSGFYSTRPYWKQLYRETENALRSAEILFTFAIMTANQNQDVKNNCFTQARTHQLYKRLQTSRRHLALFAHHDGAPGVSDVHVMNDYGYKLNEAIIHSLNLQLTCMVCLIKSQGITSIQESQIRSSKSFPMFRGTGRRPIPLNFTSLDSAEDDDDTERNIIVLNTLSWTKLQLISVLVTCSRVQVFGPYGELIPSQLNPLIAPRILSYLKMGMGISKRTFELVFYYPLEAVSITKFRIICRGPKYDGQQEFAQKAKVYYKRLNLTGHEDFEVHELRQEEDVTISNKKYKLYFNSSTGLLEHASLLQEMKEINLKLKFGGYTSVPKNSGPYLFMPAGELEENSTSNPFRPVHSFMMISNGPLESKIQILSTSLQQVVKLHQRSLSSSWVSNNDLVDGIFISNVVDVSNMDGEYYMRFDSDLSNDYGGIHQNETVFFTDQSGFTFEKRVTVKSIGLEGNYYPITTLGYIQDGFHHQNTNKGKNEKSQQRLRLSLIVGRAHGLSSYKPGRLEVMVERRVKYDDNRGIGQGVLDNRPTMSNYILKLESVGDKENYQSDLPSLETHHLSQLLNYPIQTFYYTPPSNEDAYNYDDKDEVPEEVYNSNSDNFYKFNQMSFFKQPLPSDTHLLLLRTQPLPYDLKSPSDISLMTLQKFGYSCSSNTNTNLNKNESNDYTYSNPNSFFHNFTNNKNDEENNNDANNFKCLNTNGRVSIKKMDLTGLKEPKKHNIKASRNNNIFEALPFQLSSFLLHFHED